MNERMFEQTRNSHFILPPTKTCRRDFWRRQFAQTPTKKQIVFDIIFGINLPILCFIFDPIVFRDGKFPGMGGGILQNYSLFAYAVSGMEIVALAAWLQWRQRLGYGLSNALAGIMLAGALFSLALGILLLPFSLLGLLVLIGILGFTPFFTALVYLRNSARASRQAQSQTGYERFASTLLLGFIVTLGGAAFFQAGATKIISRSMQQMMYGDDETAVRAERRLYHMRWLINTNEIANAYVAETDPARKERLAKAYREIAGEDIEIRLRILSD